MRLKWFVNLFRVNCAFGKKLFFPPGFLASRGFYYKLIVYYRFDGYTIDWSVKATIIHTYLGYSRVQVLKLLLFLLECSPEHELSHTKPACDSVCLFALVNPREVPHDENIYTTARRFELFTKVSSESFLIWSENLSKNLYQIAYKSLVEFRQVLNFF